MADSGRGLGYTDTDLPNQLLAAPADGLDYYLTPSFQMIEECSVYRLLPEEKLLLDKYCRGRGTILDLACGLGRTTLCIHEMGFLVVGMDFSAALVQVARRRFPYMDMRIGSFNGYRAIGFFIPVHSCLIASDRYALPHNSPLGRTTRVGAHTETWRNTHLFQPQPKMPAPVLAPILAQTSMEAESKFQSLSPIRYDI